MNKVNAHPHTVCGNSTTVVSGGIANYKLILDRLSIEDHRIASKCCFEIVPRMIESLINRGESSRIKASLKVFREIEGFASLAILFQDGTIVAYTSEQSLYIGFDRDIIAVSSTRSSLYLRFSACIPIISIALDF